ncbi:MAG: M14 family metallopeptidase, partial [Phycisphaerales bacterium]|nr:M14 family metallopeptidase [Phycisphaerales bacterium]
MMRHALGIMLAAIAQISVSAARAQLQPTSQPRELLTVAETSDYRATARYDEMIKLLEAMDASLPYTTRINIGKSAEGRDIPALIVADPPVATPEEMRRQRDADGKIVVLAIGNIHAGEVDGKEALPMVIREATRGSRVPLLQRLILIIAPIYNCDGNERISRANRPEQNGPENGVGVRHNALDLDLNRDFIKLEAPETQGLVAAFNHWDPDIFIDMHTTNGSYHRYLVTWEGPKSPAGDAPLIEFVRDRMLQGVARIAKERYELPTFVYGDFAENHTRWVTYPAEGRYSTTYFGLRGRISVLSESYSYATYRRRIEASRDFMLSVMEFAAANRDDIRRVLREVDERAVRRVAAGDIQFAIQTDAKAAPHKVIAAGFVEKPEGKTTISTGEPKDYEVELMTHFHATRTVALPEAY